MSICFHQTADSNRTHTTNTRHRATLMPPPDGVALRAAFDATCLRGALPPVDLRAVYACVHGVCMCVCVNMRRRATTRRSLSRCRRSRRTRHTRVVDKQRTATTRTTTHTQTHTHSQTEHASECACLLRASHGVVLFSLLSRAGGCDARHAANSQKCRNATRCNCAQRNSRACVIRSFSASGNQQPTS